MKNLIVGATLFVMSITAYAADPLNGTLWKSLDDETHQAKSLISFKQHSDGSLVGTIQKVFNTQEERSCSVCVGNYHNKPLKGITIVWGLKPVGGNKYEDGHVLDPKKGKNYNLKAELKDNNRVLAIRGYMGVSLLGRNQTWVRVN